MRPDRVLLRLLPLLLTLLCLSGADPTRAQAANLLANPGFDTCDFTGWTVGGAAVSGVGADGAPLAGTYYGDNQVNVHAGACAAWAKLAMSQVPPKNPTLSQTVTVAANTVYEVGFWASLGTTLGSAGATANITVNGTPVYNQVYAVANGVTAGDYVKVAAMYTSGPAGGPVTVTFELNGSGTSLVGFSFDDLSFRSVYPASLVSVGDAPAAPQLALLSPGRPNPFRDVTSIPFSVPAGNEVVRLSVFDAAGRRVRTLVDEVRPAGRYVARWDGRDDGGATVAPGAYFVSLRIGSQRVDRKLVLLR